MTTFILTGKKSICNFMGRSWSTIERWIMEREFPARKIDGIWESDSELITAWRRKQITGGSGRSPGGAKTRGAADGKKIKGNS